MRVHSLFCAAVAYHGRPSSRSGYDSDESITSPEFRPADELGLPSPAAAAPAAGVVAGSAPPEQATPVHAAVGFAEKLAAIEQERDSKAAELAAQLSALGEEEQAAKQRRRAAAADSEGLSKRIAELQAAEQQAVEAEEYEAAGSLSAEQEAAQAALAAAQQQLQAAEASLRCSSDQRLQLVQQQAAAAEAAAADLQALCDAQQQEQAAAEERAAQAAAAAAASQADAEARLQQLRQQAEELQRGIQEREGDLERRQDEEAAQLMEQRQGLVAAHAALEAEVAAARCGCGRVLRVAITCWAHVLSRSLAFLVSTLSAPQWQTC